MPENRQLLISSTCSLKLAQPGWKRGPGGPNRIHVSKLQTEMASAPLFSTQRRARKGRAQALNLKRILTFRHGLNPRLQNTCKWRFALKTQSRTERTSMAQPLSWANQSRGHGRKELASYSSFDVISQVSQTETFLDLRRVDNMHKHWWPSHLHWPMVIVFTFF